MSRFSLAFALLVAVSTALFVYPALLNAAHNFRNDRLDRLNGGFAPRDLKVFHSGTVTEQGESDHV